MLLQGSAMENWKRLLLIFIASISIFSFCCCQEVSIQRGLANPNESIEYDLRNDLSVQHDVNGTIRGLIFEDQDPI